MIFEVKEKLALMPRGAATNQAALADANEALEALGYSPAGARSVLDTAPNSSSTDDIIKYALSRL